MELTNRVAIVTGASEGIGRALAQLLVQEGAQVVLAARSKEKLEALAAELGAERALAVPTDVAQPAQIERLVARAVERFGGVDILVNNAGFGIYGLAEEIEWEHFRRMWEVNFFGAVACTRAALPHLRQRSGAVVNVSSVAGKIPLPYMAGYCATKFALNAFSDGLRMELARVGVHVLTVCPGRVRTNFHQAAYRDGKDLPNIFQQRHPTGVSADAVARATLKALRRGRREVIIPWRLRLAASVRNLLPGLTERVLRSIVRDAPAAEAAAAGGEPAA
ncbi:MAG: SDR family oxidoreductase [Candidatus Acidiferrales bacterium]